MKDWWWIIILFTIIALQTQVLIIKITYYHVVWTFVSCGVYILYHVVCTFFNMWCVHFLSCNVYILFHMVCTFIIWCVHLLCGVYIYHVVCINNCNSVCNYIIYNGKYVFLLKLWSFKKRESFKHLQYTFNTRCQSLLVLYMYV